MPPPFQPIRAAQFHSDNREVHLSTLRGLIAGLSDDEKMPAGTPENVLSLLSNFMEGAGKVDLSATWTNEFVEKP